MEWKDIITWILVILGWFFVHKATMSREEWKEKRESINSIIKEIKEVEELCINFQTSIKFSNQAQDTLIWKVNRIIKALYRPPLKYLHIPTEIIIRFRQRLTYNTDKSTFSTQAHDGEIISSIHEVIDDLIDEIDAGKNIYFS